MKRALTLAMAVLAMGMPSCGGGTAKPIVVGAVYPLSGPQAEGGKQEYRGVRLAAELVNESGGAGGHAIELRAVDTPSADAAPSAIAKLHRQGVGLVVGSYGSTISAPAADAASRAGMLFWEGGAVGEMMPTAPLERGGLVFRVAPSGLLLGSSAIEFVARHLARLLHRDAHSLRFAVANVNDAYGREVGRGALAEIRALHLPLAGSFGYDPRAPRVAKLVGRIKASHPDVLFVAAYLQDGIALRRETVRRHVPLVASIGTSSSYCMPQFGEALGRDAVGLFASDKPDADSLAPEGLKPSARALLERARRAYRERYGGEMSAPALAGFAAGWALFRDVIPRAARPEPAAVARAAHLISIPTGGLPNGSGLRFGRAGTPDSGANLRAESVIWEWTGVGTRAVVWPPRFATTAVEAIPLSA
jgi:branched-chain amino acid transport system substrate-binding protein